MQFEYDEEKAAQNYEKHGLVAGIVPRLISMRSVPFRML
jgi:uncharacterized DUF497 family protein